MTATVEAVVEQLDLAPIILTERINPTIGRVVPLPDSDRGTHYNKICVSCFHGSFSTFCQ